MNKVLMMVLNNWRDLNEGLSELREDQVKEMLDYELVNGQRKTVIERLHQRLTMLRAKRERAELMGQIK
jgi:hypothetical protein